MRKNTKEHLEKQVSFLEQLKTLQNHYAEVNQRLEETKKDRESIRQVHLEQQNRRNLDLNEALDDIAHYKSLLSAHFSDAELASLTTKSAINKFIEKNNITHGPEEELLHQLRDKIEFRNYMVHQGHWEHRIQEQSNLHQLEDIKQRLLEKRQEIQNAIIRLVDQADGVTVMRDGKPAILEYKIAHHKHGIEVLPVFSDIESFSKQEVTNNLGHQLLTNTKKKKVRDTKDDDEKRAVKRAREISEQLESSRERMMQVHEELLRLETFNRGTYKVGKKLEEEEVQQVADDKRQATIDAYLEEKANRPASQIISREYSDVKHNNKKMNTAVGSLNEEDLTGRKLEFLFLPKNNNKDHARQMLALRWGIIDTKDTIIGEVISRTDSGNQVELYLEKHDKVVVASIEKELRNYKWGISTFLQELNGWSEVENTSSPEVPSGLSQEIDMKYTLMELTKFYGIIKKNYKKREKIKEAS